ESWHSELPNGIRVMGVQAREVPTTAVLMRMKVGLQHEPRDKLGVANLTAYVMNEATELSSAEDLNTRLARLSSTLRFYTDGEYAFMSIGGLTATLDETLEIAAERLTRPKFDPSEFDRWQKQALKLIALGEDYAPEVANGVVPLVLFGADNNFAYSSIGLKESVENVTLEDVRNFYAQHYSPSVAEILVISDLAQDEVMESLSVLSAWEAKSVPAPADVEPFPELRGGAIYLVDKAGAKQSEIRVASRSAAYDALGEHYRLTLLNHPLAGSFNSRINLNLREDKGYTYGAFGYLRADETTGRYVVQTSVRNDVTAAAIEEIFSELDAVFDRGITQEELEFTRRAIGQRDALAYEPPNHRVHIMALTQRYGLGHDWPRQQHGILANIGVDELNELAREHLDVDEMITVVVGDKAEILSDLEALGRPVIEIDRQARPVGGSR
ncbi:MAG: insulinase family protein, partial [Proteobacteria bacterium]|nr:insulinase family protein [Pseudomonadota bacterium]